MRLAGSTAEVVAAVQDAVNEGRRVVATSGGHCLEGFVADPEVRVIVDVSPMKRVYFDAAMGAIAVEAGATVGETFAALYDEWGTVIPLGEYPGLGIGGHVAGGGFGFLCRQLGRAKSCTASAPRSLMRRQSARAMPARTRTAETSRPWKMSQATAVLSRNDPAAKPKT